MSPHHAPVNSPHESNDPSLLPHDELSPLLADRTQSCPTTTAPINRRDTFPKRQLSALCAIRLADPIAFTQIFPYVNEMMASLGVAADPSRVGFYSGLVESVFAFAQLISIYHWAQVSDIIGRRPIVLAGAIGIAITTLLFGVSTTLPSVLASRFLAGLFSGNVAVVYSVLGEITDKTNQALAFPIFGLCWPLGAIIGPLIGGALSKPTEKFQLFVGVELFQVFPYLLPCIVAALIALIGAIVGFYFLDETLPRKRYRSEKDLSISYGTNDHNDGTLHQETPPSISTLLRVPVMRALCLSGCTLSFLGTAFDVVFVLFCYSPIQMGGLGFSASQIGIALATCGTVSAAIQLFVLPFLLRTFNCARLYKTCMALWPYAFLILPFLNWLAASSLDKTSNESLDSHTRSLLWIGVGIALALSRVACLAYSLNMILVKENAATPGRLGCANGIAQFAQCFSRAIAPAFVSTLFAFSIENEYLGGHIWSVIMAVFSLLSWWQSRYIPEVEMDTSKPNMIIPEC